MEKKPKNWIQGMHMKKNALHKELHVKPGEKIPQSKLTKAAHSSDPKLRKQVTLSRTLRGLRK